MSESRRGALDEVYEAIETSRVLHGGLRRLSEVTARSGWPTHGIYLFFEEGEVREDGLTPRVTRVGTHALTSTSRTTLWNRLSQHRGSVGGANPGGATTADRCSDFTSGRRSSPAMDGPRLPQRGGGARAPDRRSGSESGRSSVP
jgi:hypothetical protein